MQGGSDKTNSINSLQFVIWVESEQDNPIKRHKAAAAKRPSSVGPLAEDSDEREPRS